MRRIILLLLLLPTITFSQSKLQSAYKEGPYTFAGDKSYDESWRAIINFFSQNGISIQTIDKYSGVITSTGFSFLKDNPRNERKGNAEPGALYTYEGYKTKMPTNPEAWVVINRLADAKIYPVKLIGNINVMLRDENGKVAVTVHLSNLLGESTNTRDKWRFYQVKSTGVLERTIAGLLR